MKIFSQNRLLTLSIALLFLAVVTPTTVSAKNKLPQTTTDGLELQQDRKLAAVYLQPGETLEDYDKVMITDVTVAFKKNWQRNYNSETIGLAGRVSDKDMERIKNRVAEEFKVMFTKQLEAGGYEVVLDADKDVLLLRPAIVNLVVNAPDVQTAGRGRTFVTSAGEMTLYMELYDSLSSDKLALVIDAQEIGGEGIGQMGNRVTNQAAADRVLKKWADTLVKHLDDVKK
jgi:hypothetical protein